MHFEGPSLFSHSVEVLPPVSAARELPIGLFTHLEGVPIRSALLAMLEGSQPGICLTFNNARSFQFLNPDGLVFLGGEPNSAMINAATRIDAKWVPADAATRRIFIPLNEAWDSYLASPAANCSSVARIRFALNVSSPFIGQSKGPEVSAVSAELLRTNNDLPWVPQQIRSWGGFEVAAERSRAYSVLSEKRPDLIASVCGAFSVGGKVAELNVFTRPEHRKAGLAKHACGACIEHCVAEGLIPVWSCREDNHGSIRLATSLGFFPVQSSRTFIPR